MAFTLPNFNLDVDIYEGPWLTRTFRDTVKGNFVPGQRIYNNTFGDDPQVLISNFYSYVLFPALTDVRDFSCGTGFSDVLELPAGSGRWYGVQHVDDSAKGFDNEHRVAVVQKIYRFLNGTEYAGLDWPIPIP